MREELNQGLIDFLKASPTPFHATASLVQRLEAAGYMRLDEREPWNTEANGRYYVTRNDSSIVAIKMGRNSPLHGGIRLVGAHTDSPCLRVKPQPELQRQGFFQLAVEVYGGALLAPWFDRDLSLAGRVTFRRDGKVDRLPLVAQSNGVRIPGLMSARSVLVDGENCFVFVFHDMTEAQRTSDELRALNNQLQQAGRLARLGAWEDERGKGLVYWSETCFDIHGLDPGQPPPGDYIDRHVAPAYRAALRERFRESIRSRTAWSMEMEVQHADGHLLWIRARGEPVIENDRVVSVRGVMQDIDEAKRAEQRLRQSEERFSRIFQLMPYPMGLSRRSNGQYVDINPAWVEMLGIPRNEAIGRTGIELGIFTAEERQRLIDQVDASGQVSDHEMTLNVRGGPPRTVLQSMRATEFDGEPCWLFSVHDITDRKREEEQVREREELLSLTFSAASLGRWDWNLQTGLVTGDSRWHAMRGLDTPHTPLASTQWTAGIAPDDIDRITSELARHTTHPGTPFDATWRVNQQGDPARWLRMWNTGAVIGATLWSIAALLFYGYGGAFERAFLMLTIYSFAIGAVPYMASQTPLFLTCMGLYFIPMILRTALNGGENDLQLAGIWCLMCLCTLGLGRAFRNMFGEMVSLRSHAQDLARKLHGEMKVNFRDPNFVPSMS